ncbi:hypothetical protein AM571_PC01811 (plasmid) [Rhizobium etli 8C-3]|uniref:Uncharacterized protein n=1 Tax=Rhizobium etli 8C-3 TaxID=538025 RepID=A0A1L5PH77_RHIET|nr:hypothetical protein AM571_PC01811 [Rhizobium etli 8C-3]
MEAGEVGSAGLLQLAADFPSRCPRSSIGLREGAQAVVTAALEIVAGDSDVARPL